MTKRELTIAGIAAATVLALVLLVQHMTDSHRAAQLVRDHQTIAADSTVRRAAVAATTAASTALDTTSRAVARVDTVWRRVASTSLARVDTIVRSAAPDTVKIGQLAHVDTSLVVAGNALADTTRQLRTAAITLEASVAHERAAWTQERADQATALATSESQHRHWGLGVTAGAAALRSPDGTIHVGPGVTVGVTYRW